MILLGFAFGNKATVDKHCRLIRKKYNSRVWLLRHLKVAGVPSGDLCQIYTSTLRSVFEYATSAYHSLLTMNQSDELERLQILCLKIIFGWDTSYREALVISRLETLKERREKILEKITLKPHKNPAFESWFPK